MSTGIDISKGLGLWMVAMLTPLLMTYIKNGEFRILVLTLIYPNLISFLSRSGRFWVSHQVIAIASIVAFVTSLLLRFSSSARDALDNPDSNKILSGTLLAVIIAVFFITMGIVSMTMGMYGEDVATD